MIATLLLIASCGAHPPAPVPTTVAAPIEEPVPAEPEPAPSPAHPGTVVFVDLDAGTSREESAASLPDTIAWVQVGAERVAVTRVESRKRGESREILKYGADGALLETTISAPPRPR